MFDLFAADAADVFGPVFPLPTVADLFDDAGLEFVFHDFVTAEIKGKLRFFRIFLLLFAGFIAGAAGFAAAAADGAVGVFGFAFAALRHLVVREADHFHLGVIDLAELTVNDGTEVGVNGFQSAQHLPHGIKIFVSVEHQVRGDAGRRHNGDDDVAALFAGGSAHDAAHGLYDIHHGFAGREEQHGVKCGDVHTFGKTADVEENFAGVFFGFCAQPVEKFRFLNSVHGAVDVSCFAREPVFNVEPLFVEFSEFLEAFLFALFEVRDDVIKSFGEGDGRRAVVIVRGMNHLSKTDGSTHRFLVVPHGNFFFEVHLRQGSPAADDLGGVGNGKTAFLHVGVDVGVFDEVFVDGQDDDLVIHEALILLHGLREGNFVEGLSVNSFVVHGVELNVARALLFFDLGAVNLRRGRHVKAFGGTDEVVVVNSRKRLLLLILKEAAGSTVGFVTNNEIDGGKGRFVTLGVVNDVH